MCPKINIRLEEPRDWERVEHITREAFWNVYHPGCTEHYVLHRFRSLGDFIPELSYVLEVDGEIIGHIMYAKAQLTRDNGQPLGAVVFGPVSILPPYQGLGYGSKLIAYTMEQAKKRGFGALIITGNPLYYQRFGFVEAKNLGIFHEGFPQDEPMPYFMAKELQPGYLYGVTATYKDPKGYEVTEGEVEAFDQKFPPKEKKVLPGQL